MRKQHEAEIEAGPELLGCPFCLEEPYVYAPDFQGDHWQIGCMCGTDEDAESEGALWRDGESFAEAAERWNRRGATLTTAERRAAVAGILRAAIGDAITTREAIAAELSLLIVP